MLRPDRAIRPERDVGPYSSRGDRHPRARGHPHTEVFGTDRPEGLNTAVLEGPAREVLLDVSASADMLVVGSRGRGGFTGLLLGSVSEACAEHARCAVLVAHDRPRGADLTETAARRHSER